MRRQRREEWLDGSPPPNRLPASPFGDDSDFYHSEDNYDSEDGSPSKSRRDKNGDVTNLSGSSTDIADAEDFVNTISGGINLNKHGRYQSFTMESPSPKRKDGNLHHRHHHTHQNGNSITTPAEKYSHYDGSDYDDESPHHRLMRQRAFLTPYKHHAIEQLHDKYHKSSIFSPFKRRSTICIARWTLGIGLAFYLALLTRSMYILGDRSMTTDDIDVPSIWDPHTNCSFGSRHTRGMGCQQPMPGWYTEQWKGIEMSRSIIEARRQKRRDRTKPMPQSRDILGGWRHTFSFDESSEPKTNDWHRILSLDEKKQSLTKDTLSEESLASINDLCGFAARNSSKISPEYYTSKSALNTHSRVVITGILNPVGLSLALRLRKVCGVQHILGVDAMYPNTVLNRVAMQDRIELLQSNTQRSASTKPIILSFFGVDSKAKENKVTWDKRATKNSFGDELDWMQSFKPTHVVHLASYSMDVYNDALVDPAWKNTRSPYVPKDHASDPQKLNPYFYPIRSGMVSMEQLLQTIARFPVDERPQFVYVAKPEKSNTKPDRYDTLFQTMKQMDEILADSYHNQDDNGLPSIGMRLPNTVYGPWGYAGSITHDIFARAAEENKGIVNDDSASSMQWRMKDESSDSLELLYVDDAVDTLISALQFRANKAMTVTVPAERKTSIEFLSSAVKSFMHAKTANKMSFLHAKLNAIDTVYSMMNDGEQSLILSKTMKTSLKDGLLKSIAWHMDRLTPFGSAPIASPDEDASLNVSSVETGDELLQRHGMETCDPYDVTCHNSFDYLPCSSECNAHKKCAPSVFDDTRELVRSVSEGCDVVMYTQMLGYNVKDAELHAEYMDDADLDDDELLVCNFAFVPRESDLVATVAGKVPKEQLAKFGFESKPSDKSTKNAKERKLEILNGRLLYRGWILIWIQDGMQELSAPDASLLKLSPSNFFHHSVKYGLFVEENFKVSPNLEDVLFLVDEMNRDKLDTRTLKKTVEVDSPKGPITQKVKYSIPAEPARKAAVLLTPLRLPSIDDPIIEQYKKGKRKLTLQHAVRFMGFEVGYKPGEKEPSSLRRQREFYERIPSYINKNRELRSPLEPWYQFRMRHWVRSRWVLHDFTMEESRLLRCDWYQEHVQWGNDLDQLSFAKIMAMRDIKRRIAHDEPDDHVKSFIQQHPELHDLTDSSEWHDMETEANKLYRDPVNWDPKRLLPPPKRLAATEEENSEGLKEEGTPVYVRIMSERVMDVSRRIWNKMRKKILKAKRENDQDDEE